VLAACAEGTPAITVSDARIPAPAGANGAFYLTLANDGDGDDRLVDVATDVAADAQLHQSRMEDGVMSMQPVDGIDLPAGDEAVLEPGGLHVMLVEIDQGLTEGDTVEVTLMFDHADPQRVTAEVVPLGGEH
jgi:copper(I)-binding protein